MSKLKVTKRFSHWWTSLVSRMETFKTNDWNNQFNSQKISSFMKSSTRTDLSIPQASKPSSIEYLSLSGVFSQNVFSSPRWCRRGRRQLIEIVSDKRSIILNSQNKMQAIDSLLKRFFAHRSPNKEKVFIFLLPSSSSSPVLDKQSRFSSIDKRFILVIHFGIIIAITRCRWGQTNIIEWGT